MTSVPGGRNTEIPACEDLKNCDEAPKKCIEVGSGHLNIRFLFRHLFKVSKSLKHLIEFLSQMGLLPSPMGHFTR